jgi:four helix bundle protein
MEDVHKNKAVKTYRDLIVWEKSMQFVTDIYSITKKFPGDELYSLTNQIRRSAVSIPSNIAEGFGRNSRKEFKRFLLISIASVFELQTQVTISFNLGYIDNSVFNKLFESSREIERMLSSLIQKLK